MTEADANGTVAASGAMAPEPDPVDSGGERRLGANYFKLFGASTISNLGDGIGTIAYPWLATAITRDPLLIALVAVVQRLPWLLFTLPAGVITDRNDRRQIMIGANVVRTILTLLVAGAVLTQQSSLPSPGDLENGAEVEQNVPLYLLLLAATLFMGMAEVLYDNSAQTFMPKLVHPDQLEKANGRLWSIESVANNFAGPPLASALFLVAFAAPFFVDALTFALSAVLITLIPASITRSDSEVNAVAAAADRPSWRDDLVEGVRWLMAHGLLRPLAIILGFLNLLGMVSGAILVLFAQEVLGTNEWEFAVLGMGGAVGGLIGGWTASWVSQRIGSGPSLWLTIGIGVFTSLVIGLSSFWPVAFVMFSVFSFSAVLWNVITVSLRQTIIPDELLGRVNSVYRFFAWGMIPIGALIGGLIVSISEDAGASRELALRMPWFAAAAGHVILLAFAAPRLTTEKMERARAEAVRAASEEAATAD